MITIELDMAGKYLGAFSITRMILDDWNSKKILNGFNWKKVHVKIINLNKLGIVKPNDIASVLADLCTLSREGVRIDFLELPQSENYWKITP